MSSSSKIFINLPVKDLKKSMDFFAALGYTFDQQFTDQNAACLIISEDIFAMLLVESFFKSFTKKEIADAKKSAEVILALSVGNREEVDKIAAKVLAAGGKVSDETNDLGWMYSKSFQDPDDHRWEIFYMDKSAMPPNNA